MYEGWTFENWETPISTAKIVFMESLVHNGPLSITIKVMNSQSWLFTFEDCPIYRNIVEDYRLELWDLFSELDPRPGSTVIVPNSKWLATIKEKEPFVEVHHPDLVHYMIMTDHDVIDVLSQDPPNIVAVPSNT